MGVLEGLVKVLDVGNGGFKVFVRRGWESLKLLINISDRTSYLCSFDSDVLEVLVELIGTFVDRFEEEGTWFDSEFMGLAFDSSVNIRQRSVKNLFFHVFSVFLDSINL